MWKCKCGEENPDSSTFCQSCGTKTAHIFKHSDAERIKNEARQKDIEEQQRKDEERRLKEETQRMINEVARRQEEEFYADQEKQREDIQQKQKRRFENLKNMGHDGYYEYKTISIADESGLLKGGRIDINKMSYILNELGLDGWRLVTAYANELGKNMAAFNGFGTNSTVDEHILIFERYIRFNS